MGKNKTVTVSLDMKKGFFISPVKKTDERPVTFSGSFQDAKKYSFLMNKQFES